jgi:hypothetical protein
MSLKADSNQILELVEDDVRQILEGHGDPEYSETKLARVSKVASNRFITTINKWRRQKKDEGTADSDNIGSIALETSVLAILQEHGDAEYSEAKLGRVAKVASKRLVSTIQNGLASQKKKSPVASAVPSIDEQAGSDDDSITTSEAILSDSSSVTDDELFVPEEQYEASLTSKRKRKFSKIAGDGMLLSWEEKIMLLTAYKEEYGDCSPSKKYVAPKENIPLGKIVENIRTGSVKTNNEQRVQLDGLGFVWSKLESDWNKNFQALKKYVEMHGHARVPCRFKDEAGLNVGAWVNRQRKASKKQDGRKITPEHKKKLENIGFVWDAKLAK